MGPPGRPGPKAGFWEVREGHPGRLLRARPPRLAGAAREGGRLYSERTIQLARVLLDIECACPRHTCPPLWATPLGWGARGGSRPEKRPREAGPQQDPRHETRSPSMAVQAPAGPPTVTPPWATRGDRGSTPSLPGDEVSILAVPFFQIKASFCTFREVYVKRKRAAIGAGGAHGPGPTPRATRHTAPAAQASAAAPPAVGLRASLTCRQVFHYRPVPVPGSKPGDRLYIYLEILFFSQRFCVNVNLA